MPSQAITNAELARLNNEAIGLNAEIEVAKKREELRKYQGGVPQKNLAIYPSLVPDASFSNAVRNVSPPAVRSTTRAPMQTPLRLRAIYGDPNRLVATIEVADRVMSLVKGDVLPDGWVIADVEPTVVHLSRTLSAVSSRKTLRLDRIAPLQTAPASAVFDTFTETQSDVLPLPRSTPLERRSNGQ